MGTHRHWAVGVSLLLVLVAARPASAQAPPPKAPQLVLPVATEVVRIDVVVTDKGGRPRAGLTGADFAVLEDGQPQSITQFEAFAAAATAPPANAPTPPVGAPTRAAQPAVEAKIPPRRYVVLVMDDIHLQAGNLLRMRKVLDRFLEREVGLEDRVALVTTSGTLHQEFTDDRQRLRKSITRLSVQDRTAVPLGVPYITPYHAEQIVRGDQEALRIAVQEIKDERVSPDPEEEAKAVARVVLAESSRHARVTLETLDSVVRGLSDLRGRKVIALVSDGFLAGITTSSNAFDMRRVTDACTRAGVVIYALDARGLVATLPGRSASDRMPARDSTFNARDMLSREGEHATRDAMTALAADTGGFLVQSTNDFSGGLRKILKDTETYYLIAYESTNHKRDGGFRRIEVRLPGVRDVRIRTRKGYLAPDDRKAAQGPLEFPPTVADLARQAEERRDSEMKRALTSPAPLTGIPIKLSADFVSVDGAGAQVVVSSHVGLGAVPFVREGDRHRATVDIAATLFDESGAVVGSLPPERATMELTDAGHAQTLRNGLTYQKAVPVKPGRYRVRVAVREDADGTLAASSEWVQAPDLTEGKLTLSGLFLLRSGDAPQVPAAGGPPVSLRSAQAERRFKRGEALYVQLFVYNPARDASGATNLVTLSEIWRGGALLASSAPESLEQGDRGAPPLPQTRSIKLDPFPPGDYEVRIVVTDSLTKETTSRRTTFSID